MRPNVTIALGVTWLAAVAPAQTDYVLSFGESLTTGGAAYADHQLLGRTAPGTYSGQLTALTGALPAQVDLDAIDRVSDTEVYFSLDCDALLGVNTYADEDVILWDGSAFSMAWDGSANGLPPRVNLDALDVITSSPLAFAFSLEESALLAGPGIIEDEDVATWNGSAFDAALDFNGAAAGVPAGADLDGLVLRPGSLKDLSFDQAAILGGFLVDDADLVEWDVAGAAFNQVTFIASAQAIPATANLDAAELLLLPVGQSLH